MSTNLYTISGNQCGLVVPKEATSGPPISRMAADGMHSDSIHAHLCDPWFKKSVFFHASLILALTAGIPTGFANEKEEAAPASFWGARPSPAQFYGIRPNEAELEPGYDKRNIRHRSRMQSDRDRAFITIPEDFPLGVGFDVAKAAPQVNFVIVQGLKPWYLEQTDAIHTSPMAASERFGLWSGFGDVTKGPNGRFYFSLGNHLYHGGNGYIIEYDPASRLHRIVVDLQETVGWEEGVWSDGKIHGDLDVSPEGDMWALTFSGPRPTAQDLQEVDYRGGHLLRYNVFTGEAEDLGKPFEGDTWAYHAWDWERGVLFGVGQAKNSVMIYDTAERRLIYGGFPPPDMTWWMRSILIDRDTGVIYSTNSDRSGEGPNNFIRWERRNNSFAHMKARPPENPALGRNDPLRAYGKRKTSDGAFWCMGDSGTIFKFYPAEDRTEYVALNWGEAGLYTTNLAVSPKGRYLYYLPGAHNDAWKFGLPVVQFDTETRRRKVLAFIHDFYLRKYGYSAYGCYGVELDEAGESLVFYTNGQFTETGKRSGYGRPALFHLRIPASERQE